MISFDRLLNWYLRWKKMNGRQFAERANTHPSIVSEVRSGKRMPPQNSIEDWADALDLDGQAREIFVRTAWLSHCPDPIRAYVAELESKLWSQKLQSFVKTVTTHRSPQEIIATALMRLKQRVQTT